MGGRPPCDWEPRDMGRVPPRKRLGGAGAAPPQRKSPNHPDHLGRRGQPLPVGGLLAAATGRSYQR